MEFIDIHTHILFGLDDGARDADMTEKMSAMAKADGTSAVIATPHCDGIGFDSERAEDRLDSVTGLDAYFGCEILYRGAVSVEAVESGNIPTLAGSRYVLVEFGVDAPLSFIEDAVYRFTVSGFTPVIAHAERYTRLDADKLMRLAEAGAYIQLNADSVMGKAGLRTRIYCARLLKRRLVHFIASDAHDDTRRVPLLGKCYDHVRTKYSQRYADALFYGNAAKIINNDLGGE